MACYGRLLSVCLAVITSVTVAMPRSSPAAPRPAMTESAGAQSVLILQPASPLNHRCILLFTIHSDPSSHSDPSCFSFRATLLLFQYDYSFRTLLLFIHHSSYPSCYSNYSCYLFSTTIIQSPLAIISSSPLAQHSISLQSIRLSQSHYAISDTTTRITRPSNPRLLSQRLPYFPAVFNSLGVLVLVQPSPATSPV